MLAADSTFFGVFTLPLLRGDPDRALVEPNSLVLTESTARKYFGRIDVVGEVMTVDFGEPEALQITGVAKDIPGNSHFRFDFLISLTSFPNSINSAGWTDNRFISYLVLQDNLTEDQFLAFTAGLKALDRKYNERDGSYDEWLAKGNFWEFFLQPITSIHLESDLDGEFEANGRRSQVFMFLAIGVIILLMACMNFMNLSTARASLRAREVAIRKVVGSDRKRLVLQFMGESILFSLAALAIALLLIELVLPGFGRLVNRPLELQFVSNIWTIPGLVLLGVTVGAISGSYPAFVLSSFRPAVMLKGSSTGRRGATRLRNCLIVIQFSAAVLLIISTITINRQLRYMLEKDVGFDREQVLVVNNPGTLTSNLSAFKENLRGHAGIIDVSGSSSVPGSRFSGTGFREEGRDDWASIRLAVCDYDFLKTLKLEMVAGRFFSPEFGTDSSGIVLNEAACKLLDWQNPLGKRLRDGWNYGTFTVIGVVRDLNYESLHQSVRPMALLLSGGPYQKSERKIAVRLNGENVPATVAYIGDVWDQFAPGVPFQYSFLDEDYDRLYTSETQTRRFSSVLCGLSIFISCIGLFGLASFTAERMGREMCIRRVLGASVSSIIGLLSSTFVKWVLLSNLVAWPVAWFVMHRWLEGFAYRVHLDLWVFGASGAVAIGIAMLTVSYQSIRAAVANPVERLRNE
jgi:putative ABC transport system permease protein